MGLLRRIENTGLTAPTVESTASPIGVTSSPVAAPPSPTGGHGGASAGGFTLPPPEPRRAGMVVGLVFTTRRLRALFLD